MHRWRPRIVFCLLLVGAGVPSLWAAVIYKWTDADGVVHFSDQSVPGAEKIVTSGPNSRGIGFSSGPGGAKPAAPAPKGTPGGLSFTQFAIDSPAPEENFTGDVTVGAHLRLEPGLKPNQQITWHLNGKQLTDQAPDATQVALQGLPRGSYILAATITDQETGESVNSDAVTFYMRQPSEFMPQHRKVN